MHIFLIVLNEVRQEYESSWSENSLVGETERLLLLRWAVIAGRIVLRFPINCGQDRLD